MNLIHLCQFSMIIYKPQTFRCLSPRAGIACLKIGVQPPFGGVPPGRGRRLLSRSLGGVSSLAADFHHQSTTCVLGSLMPQQNSLSGDGCGCLGFAFEMRMVPTGHTDLLMFLVYGLLLFLFSVGVGSLVVLFLYHYPCW